jgi:hypothetical protein
MRPGDTEKELVSIQGGGAKTATTDQLITLPIFPSPFHQSNLFLRFVRFILGHERYNRPLAPDVRPRVRCATHMTGLRP